jgi:hypothetical protein
MPDIIDSVINFSALMHHAGIDGSELIHQVRPHVVGRAASPSHRYYFIEMLRGKTRAESEIEPYIGSGNQYFENASPEEKGQWDFFYNHKF